MSERQRRQEFWQREQASWPNREFSTFLEVNGTRWHLQKAGSGPNVLLVHGAGASGHSWRALLPPLSGRYSVLSVDLPGHGFSDALPGRRPALDAMAESLGSLLREASFDPSYCVGHSAGVAILCQMALEGRIAPRLIVGINAALKPFGGAAAPLFSSTARLLAGTRLFSRLLAARARDRRNVIRILEGTGSRLDADSVQLYHRLVSNPLHLAGALDMMAHWDLGPFWRELHRLREPLVLMVGSDDRAVPPAQAVDVQRRLVGAQLVPLPGLGHLAHEESPELVTRQLLRLFDRSAH